MYNGNSPMHNGKSHNGKSPCNQPNHGPIYVRDYLLTYLPTQSTYGYPGTDSKHRWPTLLGCLTSTNPKVTRITPTTKWLTSLQSLQIAIFLYAVCFQRAIHGLSVLAHGKCAFHDLSIKTDRMPLNSYMWGDSDSTFSRPKCSSKDEARQQFSEIVAWRCVPERVR